MTDEIRFEQINRWGIITLNRPEALNALTHTMVKAMHRQLSAWQSDDAVAAVMICGAGDRAFCAGGDIRWLHDTAKHNTPVACEFFRDEYTNNAAIFHYAKPYVAMIDGIVMGGGVGVSVHGDFRIAGDKTMFAMPETGIGLFPDVGGGYFMPRLEGGLGLYYALTGARAKAGDCLASGIATHYVVSDAQEAMITALQGLSFESGDAHQAIRECLTSFSSVPADAPILDLKDEIAGLFASSENLQTVFARLGASDTDFAKTTRTTLDRMSPTSLKLTFEQMKRGIHLDFNETMKMEFRIVSRVMENRDFFEGVRALIIDKDKSPVWSPADLSEIDEAEIATYFASLGDKELQL